MRTIGTRELKTHLAEVLRRVREERESFAVTHRGRTIARLVPEQESVEEFEARWARMDAIAERIGRKWPPGVSAAEAVAEQRREL